MISLCETNHNAARQSTVESVRTKVVSRSTRAWTKTSTWFPESSISIRYESGSVLHTGITFLSWSHLFSWNPFHHQIPVESWDDASKFRNMSELMVEVASKEGGDHHPGNLLPALTRVHALVRSDLLAVFPAEKTKLHWSQDAFRGAFRETRQRGNFKLINFPHQNAFKENSILEPNTVWEAHAGTEHSVCSFLTHIPRVGGPFYSHWHAPSLESLALFFEKWVGIFTRSDSYWKSATTARGSLACLVLCSFSSKAYFTSGFYQRTRTLLDSALFL